MTKYLRNKVDGFIYDWHPVLAKNKLCEEVTEEQAYPERFMDAKQATKAVRNRKSALTLTTDDIDAGSVYVAPEINEDASRSLPT